MIDIENMPESDRRKLAEARPDLVRRLPSIEDVYDWSDERRAETKRVIAERKKPRGEPNKLEADFSFHVTGAVCKYEVNTFYLSDAVSYKPDFTVYCIGSHLAFIEVKLDTSRMNRQARSRLATQNRESLTKLKLCAAAWPNLKWYRAVRDADHVWQLFDVTAKGIARKPTVVSWMV